MTWEQTTSGSESYHEPRGGGMNRPALLWDDTYHGPRFTYGLTYRPASGANVPRGYIIYSARPHPRFAHGTIDYPRELTDREISGYELTELARADRTGPVQPSGIVAGAGLHLQAGESGRSEGRTCD